MSRLPKRWASTHHPGHNEHIPGTTAYLRSRTFQSYFNMMVRTHYESATDWEHYGGRGITVCAKWIIGGFQAFLDDMGHRPRGTTLDRINVNRGYTPSNCRWATPKEQNRNRRNSRAA